MFFGKVVERFGRNAHKARHLIDKRARAARATPVHSHFEPAGKEQDLRVFAAEFHYRVGMRAKPFHRAFFGVNFLYERKRKGVRNAHSRRSRHGNGHRFVRVSLVDFAEDFDGGFGNSGTVSHVFFEYRLVAVQKNGFKRGRAYVESEFKHFHSLPLSQA